MNSPGAGGMRRHIAIAAGVLVALIVLIGYGHTLSYPFLYDDVSSIRDNAVLDRPGDLRALWSFRPSRIIVHLSLAWNVALGGRDPAAMRAVNLVIHALCALLVGWIAFELSRLLARARGDANARGSQTRGTGALRSPAWQPAPPELVGLCAALLFAAHPLATQAVTYLIQRTTSLAALFELAAVALYLRARAGGPGMLWVASWTAALLAAFTKEMAVILPVAIGLIEWTLRRAGSRGPGATKLAPYLLVIPLIGWAAQLHSDELGRAASGLRETADISRWSYLLTQWVVIPRYLALWLFPRGQNLDPDVAIRLAPDTTVLLGLAVLVGASVVAFRLAKRRPLVLTGWAWFLVCLIPESSIVPIRDVMVEHRTYLPMAGLTWAAAALLAPPSFRSARLVVLMLLVFVLAGVTRERNRTWRDALALWSDVAAKSPLRPRGHNNLAMALDALGRSTEAEASYKRALALDPRYLYARVNLGRLYGMEGRYREAITMLEQARQIDPGQVEVWNNLGLAWWGLGDAARAADAFEDALEVAPGAREPAENLARLRASVKAAMRPPRTP